jgi:hypothetical protein
MAIFRRQRKKPVVRPPDMPRDPFVAIPLRAPEVEDEAKTGSSTVTLVKSSKPLKDRMYNRIAGWLHYRHKVRLRLDEYGTFFWQAVDGQRSLGEIADLMKTRFEWPEDKCKECIMLFVKELMIRHFLVLEVPRILPGTKSEIK